MSATFDAAIFQRRRERLAKEMQDGVAILPSAPVAHRNGDVSHEYRQNSDFYYMTGFEEPESLALIIKQGSDLKFVLFVPKRDKEMEIWHGRRAGPEGATSQFRADEAFTLDEIDAKVPDYLKNLQRVYVHFGDDAKFDERVMNWMNRVRAMKRTGVNAPTELHDTSGIIHEMRLIKTDDDIKQMREAGRISAEAHCAGMRGTRPDVWEYQVQAEIEYEFRTQGSPRNGYPSIVATGNNANCLHYHENNQQCKDGQLILVDAGCECGMYSADITRTWPVNGVFSDAQKEVYNWVLKAQMEAIERCRVGFTFREVHDRAVEIITEGLVAMGLLEGDPAEIIAAQKKWDDDVKDKKVDPKKDADKKPRTYREFYMHNTGHWLGMDVHDVGRYKQGDDWTPLKPGHYLTVEPGIYINADRDDVPEKYKGIGVRIEDDILVTADAPENMTSGVPRTTEDIEALMAEAKAGV